MIKVYLAIGVLFLFSNELFGQESKDKDKYGIAYRTILSDTLLSNFYCNGKDSFDLKVYPELRYFPISRFKKVLLSDGENHLKNIEKIDKRQNKASDNLNYGIAPIGISKLNPNEMGCAIICFDKLKGPYLLAEIGFYSKGENWRDVVSNRRSHFVLFDFRSTPLKYHLLPVIR